MWRTLLAAFALAVAAGAQIAPTGIVEGVVVDGDGKPLAGATVFIGTVTRGPRALTDAVGRFRLDNVPPGLVGLDAFKESDGYPYDMFSFYIMPGAQLPTFNLAPGETRGSVVIRLGAKAAYLKLQVRDDSGNALKPSLSFSRPDLGQFGDYQRSYGENALIPVPPVPFRLTVQEEGYDPWHYGGDAWQTHGGLIELSPGQTLALSIALRHRSRKKGGGKQ